MIIYFLIIFSFEYHERHGSCYNYGIGNEDIHLCLRSRKYSHSFAPSNNSVISNFSYLFTIQKLIPHSTTTELTTTISTSIANLVGLGNVEGGVEVVIRALFFALNLIFNGIMWTLFTKALARGTSTTQVSILNTSSNFMITAVLGWLIFSESLPPLWFLGAGLLVAGNVIIGRRDEGEKDDGLEEGILAGSGAGVGAGAGLGEEEELLGDEVEMDDGLQRSGKPLGEEDDILEMNPHVAERESDEGLI